MDFDPNKKQPPAIEWATYIPDRKPQFKTHKNRGQALNAFNYRSNVILYKYDYAKSEWVEVYRVENFSDRGRGGTCDNCGDDTDQYMHSVWVKDEKGKVADPPKRLRVCYGCNAAVRHPEDGRVFKYRHPQSNKEVILLDSLDGNETIGIPRDDWWKRKRLGWKKVF